MRTEIRRIQKDLSLTCLYVTHDQKEALTMSDRIMVMQRGHIEQLGSPFDLYDDPASAFVADFIGQANLIPGTLTGKDGDYGIFSVNGRNVKARLGKQNPPEIGKEALLVVRPENLSFASSAENTLPVKIVNRLFEGDKIDYHVQIQGVTDKTYSMGIPFLPGMDILDEGLQREASFVPQAGVIIKKE